eukprot:UN12079
MKIWRQTVRVNETRNFTFASSFQSRSKYKTRQNNRLYFSTFHMC